MMFGRLARLALIGSLTLAGGAFTIACDDGGGTLTLEEYFERIDELDQESSDRSEELLEQMNEAGEDDFDQARELFDEQVVVFDRFVDDIDELDPPVEVEDAHNEFEDGLRALRGEFSGIQDALADADSLADAEAAFAEVDLSAIERVTAACVGLEEVAADNDIGVDLECEVGE